MTPGVSIAARAISNPETVVAADLRTTSCALVAVRHDGSGSVEPLSSIAVDLLRADSRRAMRDWRRGLKVDGALRLVVWPRIGDAGAWPLDQPPGVGKMRLSAGAIRARVRPLVRAGFRVHSVMWPAQAIASLVAALGVTPGIVVALTAEAACLMRLSNGRALVTRYVTWPSNVTAAFAEGNALPRYHFAARLAPYVRDMLRDVDAHEPIYLCGTLPKLRVLAVPFVEEFDREIEVMGEDRVDAADVETALVGAESELAWAAALLPGEPSGAAVVRRRWWFARSAAAL